MTRMGMGVGTSLIPSLPLYLLIISVLIQHPPINAKESEIEIPDGYSIHDTPPTPDGGPTVAEFHILLIDIRDIDEVKEELTLEFNLQMYWKDARLTHWSEAMTNKSAIARFAVLNPQLIKDIWHPDIFVDKVKKIEQPKVISIPQSLRVYFKDGMFRYSGRYNVKLACQMVFHYYPADTQRCMINIKSYSYSNKSLYITWKDGKRPAIKTGLVLPNFAVALGNTDNFMIKTSSSAYSGIRFTVILRRHLGFHLIQTYLPSCLFVIVSFLTFLVSHESMLECMTLCMTTLLTLTAMFASVKQNTPTVSYIKGLDIWMVTCMFCVFFTLLEHTILLKLRRRLIDIPSPEQSPGSERRKKKRKSEDSSTKGGGRGRPVFNTNFNMNMLGRVRGKKKNTDTERQQQNMPSLESREPLTPQYHKCTVKCTTCSSESNSGNETPSPVVKIRRFSNTSNVSNKRMNGGPNLNHSPTPSPPQSNSFLSANSNTLPIQTLAGSLSPVSPMRLLNPATLGGGGSQRSMSVTNLNLSPAEALLLNSTAFAAMTPKEHKRFKYSQTMELLCSKLIPISFVIFNCIYWPWLLTSADYYNMSEFLNTTYVD